MKRNQKETEKNRQSAKEKKYQELKEKGTDTSILISDKLHHDLDKNPEWRKNLLELSQLREKQSDRDLNRRTQHYRAEETPYEYDID